MDVIISKRPSDLGVMPYTPPCMPRCVHPTATPKLSGQQDLELEQAHLSYTLTASGIFVSTLKIPVQWEF